MRPLRFSAGGWGLSGQLLRRNERRLRPLGLGSVLPRVRELVPPVLGCPGGGRSDTGGVARDHPARAALRTQAEPHATPTDTFGSITSSLGPAASTCFATSTSASGAAINPDS